ncbi:MAG TPA: inositol monophosphatase family protein, partial [Gammaproteobacteria bacterium]|nr:inositol monophosphatase family protein [Gammaproteobacteria bacterium]
MTTASRAELLRFAVEVVRDAGAIALKYFRTAMPVTNKSANSRYDPVTQADREVERLIRRRIETVYPAHGIVGEEEASRAGDGIHQWIIDPIDGTRAFISGIPLWGILLGLQIRNECILGVLHQPFLG